MVSNDQNHFVREAPPLSVPPVVIKVLEVVEVDEVVEVVLVVVLGYAHKVEESRKD